MEFVEKFGKTKIILDSKSHLPPKIIQPQYSSGNAYRYKDEKLNDEL